MNAHAHQPLVTVLGATGGIGGAILNDLARALRQGPSSGGAGGRRLRAVSRSITTHDLGPDAATAEVVQADLMDAGQTVAACADSDVVVLAAQPPYPRWRPEWPTMMTNVIDAVEQADARLVFVDNLYAYAPAAGPISAASPQQATDTKGRVRAQLGQMVLDAHEAGRIRAVIGRFTDYFGPGAENSGLMMMAFGPARAGKTMRGLFDLDQPHAFNYLPDAAAMFAAMVDNPEGDGRIWILPAAAITQRDLLGLITDQLASPVKVGKVGSVAMAVAGVFNAQIRESRSVSIQFDRPWQVDGTEWEAQYGPAQLTSWEAAVELTLAG